MLCIYFLTCYIYGAAFWIEVGKGGMYGRIYVDDQVTPNSIEVCHYLRECVITMMRLVNTCAHVFLCSKPRIWELKFSFSAPVILRWQRLLAFTSSRQTIYGWSRIPSDCVPRRDSYGSAQWFDRYFWWLLRR